MQIRAFLELEEPAWRAAAVPAGRKIVSLELLFERIDPSRIEEEAERLKRRSRT